jgi:hypothetical protein
MCQFLPLILYQNVKFLLFKTRQLIGIVSFIVTICDKKKQLRAGELITVFFLLTMNCKYIKKYVLIVQFVQILCDGRSLQPLVERLYIPFFDANCHFLKDFVTFQMLLL